ncbi:MAG: HD domain-containing protein [Ruminococcaceae bacterium]|nr:HD domain-containing protein [Oscillospiraceae bacterium]
MITYKEIKNDPTIRTYISAANDSLAALGFTDHSVAHVAHVAEMAGDILEKLGFDERTVELTKIAGFLHDIGNLVNRTDHSQSGALLAFRILDNMGMPPAEIAAVTTAIGNHDEGTGDPVNAISAALILADKSDVRRSRVRNQDPSTFDIHDRVNYSVTSSKLDINAPEKTITLALVIDTELSSVMNYFEIFLKRMIMCRKAAQRLGLQFRLTINDQQLM